MECLVEMHYKKWEVQITPNFRPLSYLEDDPRLPVRTPSPILFMNCNVLPELQPYCTETTDLHKRANHLLQCKEAVWRWWSKEYLAQSSRKTSCPSNCSGKSTCHRRRSYGTSRRKEQGQMAGGQSRKSHSWYWWNTQRNHTALWEVSHRTSITAFVSLRTEW